MQIRYVRDLNGNFVVSLIGYSQQLISLPRFFAKVTGISPKTVLGCMSIDIATARAIGFVVPEEVSVNHAHVCSAEPVPAVVGA